MPNDGESNPDKCRAASKLWRTNNPNKIALCAEKYKPRRRKIRKRELYGMTESQYQVLYQLQNGVCSICGEHEKQKNLAIDHCHKTGKIRGLLCQKCNSALGLFCDDLDILASAVSYLRNVAI